MWLHFQPKNIKEIKRARFLYKMKRVENLDIIKQMKLNKTKLNETNNGETI